MQPGMGAGRWRTCPPPDTGRGTGPARYELSRSDDEGDCGRGRSERSERSSAGGWTPFRTRVYEKGMTSSHIDFLVILLLVYVVRLILDRTDGVSGTPVDKAIIHIRPHEFNVMCPITGVIGCRPVVSDSSTIRQAALEATCSREEYAVVISFA